mmetsp:Transcript_58467/g.143010  ORF Transcript_58467/g.143010 Transcript_58467/m.143010 type:complete len:140 (+) Transcript_58467:35-454(+)
MITMKLTSFFTFSISNSSNQSINQSTFPSSSFLSHLSLSLGITPEKTKTKKNHGSKTKRLNMNRAQDRSKFSPVHLNHSDKDSPGCNCIRLLSDDDDDDDDDDGVPRVAFFTSRPVEKEEELCFSYGDNFWTDRQDMKI